MTKKNIGITFEILMEKVKTYIDDEQDLEVIEKAYKFAEEKHFGIKRMTGEEYIEHPLNVAYILTDIFADAATISSGLLHDILEDCDVTVQEFEKIFGHEITALVDGVTKLNKLNFDTINSATIATHKKILVGLCEDVRVIIIKLADRLHNMRTLWVHTEKKQKEKAIETLEILTPIAHRLGMNKFKSELEDLSLRYSKPDVYFQIVEQLNQTKNERDRSVLEMQESVSDILNKFNIKHEIKGRAKSIYSIYKKLDKGRKMSDIYDLLALRVYVETEQECYQALGMIHSKYRPIPKRFKDYIAMPKTNMYQSLHTTVFGIDGYLYEIQIRTYKMDEIAESGIASHWSYKENGGRPMMQNTMEQKLQFFRSIIELNNEEINDEEFVKSVTEDVFKNTIYVFTPKGDVVELPLGSTPIDFAYKVHSGVGDKMIGAIVNNSIVPLDYELNNQDIIKINTNKNSTPSREWINLAHTTQAKNKIRSFFKKIDKDEYLKKGEDLLNKELRKRKIVFNEFLSNTNIQKILDEYKFRNTEEMYINIGNNKTPAAGIINFINGDNDTKEEIILRKAKNTEVIIPIVKNDIIVEGIADIKVNIASCCNPIPGDKIIGYITKGYGITVHRALCPNIKELDERIIDVRWNDSITKKYPTNILIRSIKSDNILVEIISKTSNSNISVQTINTYNNENDTVHDLTVLVENIDKLNKFIADIKCITNVIEVERIIK
ncbi:MAG: RelA/SpoT family protein [Bacilli bacterium]